MTGMKEKYPKKKGKKASPKALYDHVHAKSFLLWCVPVSATCFDQAIQAGTMYLVHYMAADRIV